MLYTVNTPRTLAFAQSDPAEPRQDRARRRGEGDPAAGVLRPARRDRPVRHRLRSVARRLRRPLRVLNAALRRALRREHELGSLRLAQVQPPAQAQPRSCRARRATAPTATSTCKLARDAAPIVAVDFLNEPTLVSKRRRLRHAAVRSDAPSAWKVAVTAPARRPRRARRRRRSRRACSRSSIVRTTSFAAGIDPRDGAVACVRDPDRPGADGDGDGLVADPDREGRSTCSGSMRVTVSSSRFATQTAPSPYAIALGRRADADRPDRPFLERASGRSADRRVSGVRDPDTPPATTTAVGLRAGERRPGEANGGRDRSARASSRRTRPTRSRRRPRRCRWECRTAASSPSSASSSWPNWARPARARRVGRARPRPRLGRPRAPSACGRRARSCRGRERCRGSILVRFRSSRFPTQTEPSPAATGPGRSPTGIAATIAFVSGSITPT